MGVFLLIGIIGTGMSIWFLILKNIAVEKEFKSLKPLYSPEVKEINELYEKLQKELRSNICNISMKNSNTVALILPDGTYELKYENNGISFTPVSMPIGLRKQGDFYFRGITLYYTIQKILYPSAPIDVGKYTSQYDLFSLLKKASIAVMISGFVFYLGIFAVKNFVPSDYTYEANEQSNEGMKLSDSKINSTNDAENDTENIDETISEPATSESVEDTSSEIIGDPPTEEPAIADNWVGTYECYYGEYSATMTISSENSQIGVDLYQEYPVFEEDTDDYYMASGEIISSYNDIEMDGVNWIYDTNNDFILYLHLNDDGSIDVTHVGENVAQFGNDYIVYEGTYEKY